MSGSHADRGWVVKNASSTTIATELLILFATVFCVVSCVIVVLVNLALRAQALAEARTKALIFLDRNLVLRALGLLQKFFRAESDPKMRFGMHYQITG